MAAAPSSSSSQLAVYNDQMYTTEQVVGWPECCVGAFMRAISHAGVRYEGICFYLNLQQKILGLTDVKIYGSTEGRTEENTEIPPLETEYDTVLLRGSYIKDLQILFLQDIRSTLPDGEIIIQIDNIPRPTTWQVTDHVLKDILSRVVALLQGISDNKSESLWSSEFWTPLPSSSWSSSSSCSPAPTLKDLDALGPRSFLPGLDESDPGVICRPRAKQGSAAAGDRKQKSILGPCPKLYMSAIQSLETAASSERLRREQQQQPSMSSSEKDDTLESPSVDSRAGRGELVSSEENRTTSDEVGAFRGRASGQGSREPRQGGRGVVSSSYRGRHYNNANANANANAAARGGRKVYWAPRDR